MHEDARPDWSIQEVTRLTGTTSRTLRHYDAVGILQPSRLGANGYRYYDEGSLVRLQRILLLRDLGLGLPAIAQALDRDGDEVAALRRHLDQLHREQQRLARRAATVARTIATLEEGGQLMASTMFDGFDHAEHQEEVEKRWGKDAYASGDAWWRGKSEDERTQWKDRLAQLIGDWAAAARAGVTPESAEAQDLARRHATWLASIPGTPGYGTGAPAKEYLAGLGEVYVADPRFAANYGGQENAALVRDALRVYAERNL
jgi:DNA-binding transcriptional MerR regulator